MAEQFIGSRLIKEGLLTEEQVEKAVERQKAHGGRLGANLVALEFITEEKLKSFLKMMPVSPRNIAETGLPQNFISELTLKTILTMGEFTMPDVSEKTCLPVSVVDQAVQSLRKDHFIEVKGGTDYARTSYQYNITSAGRTRALELLDICQYVGPAPVALDDYRRSILSQTVKNFEVHEEEVRKTFSHMVISGSLMKRAGLAISSGKSMFLYGPPGNGKTTIAQAIGNLFREDIYIPYSLYVSGQIITIYNPVNHQAVEERAKDGLDRRWILIKRPIIMVGGELKLNMLDLNFNPISKFYDAPLQMKSNNGMFVIDDFGRQLVHPKDLLNRWIVPLDRRTDYMTLHTGMSFEIPFDQLVVFSTNIEPRELVDEAFLRRIRYKIKVDYPTEEEYRRIFTRICEINRIEFREEVFDHLLKKYKDTGIKPNACHPRDLIDQIIDLSHYYNSPPVMSVDSIDMAWDNYVVEL